MTPYSFCGKKIISLSPRTHNHTSSHHHDTGPHTKRRIGHQHGAAFRIQTKPPTSTLPPTPSPPGTSPTVLPNPNQNHPPSPPPNPPTDPQLHPPPNPPTIPPLPHAPPPHRLRFRNPRRPNRPSHRKTIPGR